MGTQTKAATTEATAARPIEPACQACRYCLRLVNEADLRCRRFPPETPNRVGHGPAEHPVVLPFDWCGEFRDGGQGSVVRVQE